jgi:glycosyltransferase involved in cell wall biosynthesis
MEAKNITEIIVVDDGSSEIAYKNLKQTYRDEPSITIHQFTENKGSAQCYNKGIDLATGKFISFLGDDDIFCKERFTTAVNILTTHKAIDIVIENVHSYDEKLANRVAEKDIIVPVNFSGNVLNLLLAKNNYHISLEGMTIRRSLIGNTRFDKRLRISQDTDFIWEICRHAFVQGAGYSHSYVKRRIHSTNITKDQTELYRCREILYSNWYIKSLLASDLKPYRWRFFRHYAHWKAINFYGLNASPIQKIKAYKDVLQESLHARGQ